MSQPIPVVSLVNHPVCLGENPPTDRQLEIAEFIVGFTIKNGYCPALQDICDHYSLSSKNGPAGHIAYMREKGLLTGERVSEGKKPSRGLIVSGYAYGDIWKENEKLSARVAELELELLAKTMPAPDEVVEKPKTKPKAKPKVKK